MNVWLTVYRTATAVFVGLVIIGLASLFLPKIREIRARQSVVTRMTEEKRAVDERTQLFIWQQERFATDPRFVERVAREELGKAKPGEIIFRFSETNGGGTGASAP